MIRELACRNFKSWRETGAIPLAPVTAFFGANSSGKTSLLQLLLLLKQTVESSDRNQVLDLGDERALVELGTFSDLLTGHQLDSSLALDITWDLPDSLEIRDPAQRSSVLFRGDELSFRTEIGWSGNGEKQLGRMVVQELLYRFQATDFILRSKDGKSEYDLLTSSDGFRFERARGRPWPLPPPVKCYGFPDQVRGYYQNAGFLSDFELRFEQLFSRLFYLGPLREYPKRQYSWGGTAPADVGRRGERVVDALLAAREVGATISRGRGKRRQTVEERVAEWLLELALISSFEVLPVAPGSKLFQVWVKRQPKAAKVLITDVGFGVSQILPVIALCYYAPAGSTLVLEQPEIHLHPSVQAGLADVFIDAIQNRGVQIILESHSEHLLRRLQRRIAEGQLGPEQTALYFCSMEQGRSKLEALRVDLFGNIENWPRDFFGDEFGEIEAMSRAALARRRKGVA